VLLNEPYKGTLKIQHQNVLQQEFFTDKFVKFLLITNCKVEATKNQTMLHGLNLHLQNL
jgi:hypothetical protein